MLTRLFKVIISSLFAFLMPVIVICLLNSLAEAIEINAANSNAAELNAQRWIKQPQAPGALLPEVNEFLNTGCKRGISPACLALGLAEVERGRMQGLLTIRQACLDGYTSACESMQSFLTAGIIFVSVALIFLVISFWLCLRPMSPEFPNFVQAFLLAWIYLLLTLIFGPIAWISTLPLTLGTSVALALSWGIVLAFLAWRAPKSQTQCILPRLPSVRLLGATLVLGLGTHIFVSVIENFGLSEIGLPDSTQGISFSAWFIVLFSPLFEQMTFNGWILAGLLRAGKPWRAILITALLFSAIRVNPAELVPIFILGLVFTWLTARTRNLTYALALEVLGNLIHLMINRFSDFLSWNGQPIVLSTAESILCGIPLMGLGGYLFLRWTSQLNIK